MARVKSEDKRNAILNAAVRVFAKQGLSAPTSLIAKEAMVANGSFFTYFDTKITLFNSLYLALKAEMASAAIESIPSDANIRDKSLVAWTNWTGWAVENRDKRKVLTLLASCDDLTPNSIEEGHQQMASLALLLNQARSNGFLKDEPMPLVVSLMNALAEATMDFMIKDSENAQSHCKTGFDAMWQMIS